MTEAEQERAAVVAYARESADALRNIATNISAPPTSALWVAAEQWDDFAIHIERGDHIEAQAHLSKGSE